MSSSQNRNRGSSAAAVSSSISGYDDGGGPSSKNYDLAASEMPYENEGYADHQSNLLMTGGSSAQSKQRIVAPRVKNLNMFKVEAQRGSN